LVRHRVEFLRKTEREKYREIEDLRVREGDGYIGREGKMGIEGDR